VEVLRKILKDLSTNSRELNSGTHGNNTTATFGFKATEDLGSHVLRLKYGGVSHIRLKMVLQICIKSLFS